MPSVIVVQIAEVKPLTVWHVPQVPGKGFKVPAATPEEARKILSILAAYDLFQLGEGIKPDFSNAQGVIERSTGEEFEDPESDSGYVELDPDFFTQIVAVTGKGSFPE